MKVRNGLLTLGIGLVLSDQSLSGTNPCNPIGTYMSGWTGDCLSGGYDSIEVNTSKNDLEFWLDQDISASSDSSSFLYPWKELTITGTNNKTNASLISIDPNTYQETSTLKELGLHTLILDNVELELNYTNLNFVGSSNILTLNNGSRISGDTGGLNFISSAAMTINSVSGENEIFGINFETVQAPFTLNVDTGSKFSFSYIGGSAGFWQFRNTSTLNVDGGTLNINHSRMDFEKGTFNLDNSAVLETFGSNTELYADTLNVSGSSSINLGLNTKLVASGDINLNSSTINMRQGTSIESEQLIVGGSSLITGEASNSRFESEVLSGASGAVLNLDKVSRLETETLILGTGFSINASDSNVYALGDIVLSGGEISLTNAGSLYIFGEIKGSDATFDVDGSNLFVTPNIVMELNNSTNVSLTNSGAIEVEGSLYTGESRLLTTDSTTALHIVGDSLEGYDGILSPGSASSNSGNDVIGTLTTDSSIRFISSFDVQSSLPSGAESLLDTGNFDGGYYHADLRLNGSTPENDLIAYGDGDVSLAAMKAIRVQVHDSPKAAELDGKEFTIIAAQSASKTGSIITLNQTIDIEEDSSIPVLIDFFIVDNQTNSKEDITLVAEEQLPTTLQKHPDISDKRNKKNVSNIMPTSSTGNTNQTSAQAQAQSTVYESLQSTTNGQIQGSFSSIHPEPISSNMTIQIEQADNLINTLFSLNEFTRASSRDLDAKPSAFFGGGKLTANELWVYTDYIDGQVSGQGDLGGFDYYISSTTLGSQIWQKNNTLVGAYFSHSNQAMNEHDQASVRFDSTTNHLGLYGSFDLAPKWSISWLSGVGSASIDSTRLATLGSLNETAQANYDSLTGYFGGRAKFDASNFEYAMSSAFIGLAYLHSKQDAFQESGAPNLGLGIEESTANSAILSFGMNIDGSLGTGKQTHARAEIRYDFDALAEASSEHEVEAYFNFDPSNKQTFVGQNRGEHSATLAFGVDHAFHSSLLASLGVAYTASSHGHELGGNASINWSW